MEDVNFSASYLNRRVPPEKQSWSHPVSVGVVTHSSSDHVEFPTAAAQSTRTDRQQQVSNTRPAVLMRTVALHTGQTLTTVITADHVQLHTHTHTQAVSGKVTFKSNALQYCVTP